MQVFLAVSPGEIRSLTRPLPPLAHAAYRIGTGSVLLRQEMPIALRGGLLMLSDREAPAIHDPQKLAAALLRECAQRNYQGIAADFEHAPSPDRIRLLRTLVQRSGKRLLILVPESCAMEGVSVLVNTAVSGGRLHEHLHDAIRRHPGAALDLQRLIMDFPLPCPSGEGNPLTAQHLEQLRQLHKPAIFFSPELCARYFTYRSDGAVHFVLFDDAETMRQKMRMAESIGFRTALVMYPEVQDIARKLLGK